MKRVVLVLVVPCLYSYPQGYLAPVSDEAVSASEVISSYGSPQAEILGEASEVVSLYSSPSEVVIDYSTPSEAASLYSSPSEVVNDYSSPKAELISSPSEVVSDYSSPKSELISSLLTEPEIIFSPSKASTEFTLPKSDYSSPRGAVISDNSLSSYSQSKDRDTASSNVATVAVRAEPIAIVRSEFTGPNDGNYHYAYETENGIKQDVTGEMRVVDDAQVYVMRGSYSYPGADGLNYVVDWYADETGYHPSAPHLPKSVQPITEEVRAAVEAQLRFAAQEEAAAASANTVVYAAPDNAVHNDDDNLAGYGEEDTAATQLLESYSLPSYN